MSGARYTMPDGMPPTRVCRDRAAHRYDDPTAPVATCLDCGMVREVTA
jgi:hypothetical protein